MDAIYHLKPNELNDDFFKILQKTFMGKEIAVTVSEITGTTEYLLSNEENRHRLLNAIDDAKNEHYAHTMTLEEMEVMVQ
jgi:hypothetical protein